MLAAREDTPAWMKYALDNVYNIDKLRGALVSGHAYQASWNLAVLASATAAVAWLPTWETDFRANLPKIDVPMLVIQGDDDQALPYPATGQRLPGLIRTCRWRSSTAVRTPSTGPTSTRSTPPCLSSLPDRGPPGTKPGNPTTNSAARCRARDLRPTAIGR